MHKPETAAETEKKVRQIIYGFVEEMTKFTKKIPLFCDILW